MFFSDDYKKRWLGLTTKAQEFDKWTHLAGCFTFTALFSKFMPLDDATLTVLLGGYFLEIHQGVSDSSDGFSFVDLAADIAGILLAVWVLTG